VGFFINIAMKTLEIFLFNLFMVGEDFSNISETRRSRNTTIIKCEGYIFEFKQIDIHFNQYKFLNQQKITTVVKILNVQSTEIESILQIIDDLCWLLSFCQQSYVCRAGYKYDSGEHWHGTLGTINNKNNIIENRGQDIRYFIEQVYPTFKKLKSKRQLTVIFGYICEAYRPSLAYEISLISHYVAIENLKQTFALDKGYKYSRGYFSHKDYPALDVAPKDLENYFPPTRKTKQYIHKKFGQVGSAEMTRRMFEDIGISRDNPMVKFSLKNRNDLIHEGLVFPFGHENYFEKAENDFHNVSNLLRKYILTLLNYKGEYYLSEDRIGPSGLIT